MKTYLKIITITFMFLICTSIKSYSIDTNTSIDFSQNIDSIKINEEFFISINASNFSNLYTLTFDMKFNPQVIDILAIEPGNFMKNKELEFNSSYNKISDNVKTLNFFQTFTGNHTGKSSEETVELIKLRVKLLRECKIPLQIINTNSDLFIGTPNFRIMLIDNLLNRINFSSKTTYIQSENFSKDDEIRLFIYDVYKKTFSRDPEEYGFNYWYNKLISYEYSVREFLLNILSEQEFIDKNLSNEEFITAIYSIVANRSPDEIGYNYWLNVLMYFQSKMDPKSAKSKLILLICNEAELKERANKINLKF